MLRLLFLIFTIIVSHVKCQESCTTPSRESGFCVPYNKCPYANELIQNYGSIDAIPRNNLNYLMKAKCSRDNEPIRLCCTLLTNHKASNESLTTEKIDYNRHNSLQFNRQEESCTTPSMERGFCVPYNKCPYANELTQKYGSINAIPMNSLNYLMKSKCSRDNQPIRLCCTLFTNHSESYESLTTEKIDYNRDNSLQVNRQEESCTTPSMERGFCVTYNKCPYANNLTQTYGSMEKIPRSNLNFILKSKCSRDNEPIRLCCTFPNNHEISNVGLNNRAKLDPRLTEDLDYNRDYNSQFNMQGFNILNELDNCGIPEGFRVAGGNVSNLAEFPWMAVLRYETTDDEYKCGGSLISERYVLTATHCVNKAEFPVIGVRLGEHDLSTNPDCKQKGRKLVCNPVTEDFGIEKIIDHPRYNQRRHINDIALIKLDRNVSFKKHIKPICLPITKASFEVNEYNPFIIAGWGLTENGNRSLVLLKAQVYEQTRSICQNFFRRIEINLKHICARDHLTGRDTCKGDSGGPLVAFNTYSHIKNFIQYGIVGSGGLGCKLDQAFPGIYTNILTYLPWITNNIID